MRDWPLAIRARMPMRNSTADESDKTPGNFLDFAGVNLFMLNPYEIGRASRRKRRSSECGADISAMYEALIR
jgi:hypothetical protein